MSPRLLDRVAADGVSRRTVNRHREVIVAIFNFGLRPEQRDRWGLTENPAAATPKRREDGPGRLEVFTVEQVEALARAAEAGDMAGRPALRDGRIAEALARARTASSASSCASPRTPACAAASSSRCAGATSRWSERVLVVERALSDTVERTTKGRRVRYVPLADQPLAALDRLAQRPNFTAPTTTCSATPPATGSTLSTAPALRRRPRRRRRSRRCASTTCATRPARCSPACSIPSRSKTCSATRTSRPPSATCTRPRVPARRCRDSSLLPRGFRRGHRRSARRSAGSGRETRARRVAPASGGRPRRISVADLDADVAVAGAALRGRVGRARLGLALAAGARADVVRR